MTSLASNKLDTRLVLSEVVYYLIFGVFCFFIIYSVYEPNLLYFKLQPFFSNDPSFIEYNFHHRLGLISLVSQFIMQLYYYPIAGAFILSLLLVGFALLYRFILSGLIKTLGRGFELIPSMIILISLKNYSTTLDSLVMFFIIALFVAGNRMLNKDMIVIKILFQAICIYLFFNVLGILSAFGLLMFLIFDELIPYRSPSQFIIVVLDLIIFAFLSLHSLGYSLSVRSFQTALPTGFYVLVPTYWYLFTYNILGILLFLTSKLKPSSFPLKVSKFFLKDWNIVLIFVLIGILFYKSLFINDLKYNSQIEYYACNKNWEKVLEHRNKTRLDDRISRFLMNRALFETGQMAENLFSVPQDGGEYTLVLTKAFTHDCAMYSSDLFFDIGFVKGGEYWAIEAMTFDPYSPRILARMATSSMLLEEPMISVKYLNILKGSFVYHTWASQLLDLVKDKNMDEIKKIVKSKDVYKTLPYIDNSNPNHIFLEILKEDSQNKMAFEYLEALYLMQNDLGNFYKQLTYLANMHYTKIPKTYQEALMIYYVKNDIDKNKFEFPIDNNTQNRFLAFNKLLYNYRDNPEVAKNVLGEGFRNSYWYYIRYDSPLSTHRSLKKRKL